MRAAQTCAMALIGTTLAGVLALPLSLVAAGNVSGLSPAVTIPVRWILNALRGTDSFIFAILFVAAVGLGPFAGVMGIAFHSTGSLAKLWSEAIEAVESGPLDAVRMTGANRVKLIAYALIPDIRPALISVALYVFEFNIRSSTVLGLVGAGGIGQDLKDSVDHALLSTRRDHHFGDPRHGHDRGSRKRVAASKGAVKMLSSPILAIAGLHKTYGGREVLRDLSLTLMPGEVVALLGASGAGKTTLFRTITRLTRPDSGTITLENRPLHTASGNELRSARCDIGLIFQQFNLIRRLSAFHNVLAGRLAYVPSWRVVMRHFSSADRQRAYAALDRVGLLDFAHVRADRLSGGQQQRVAIARVLVQQCRLVLADEPVASLDPASAETVLQTLRAVAAERGLAVLCSLHQTDLALRYSDRVIGLRAGAIVCNATPHELGPPDISAIYEGIEP